MCLVSTVAWLFSLVLALPLAGEVKTAQKPIPHTHNPNPQVSCWNNEEQSFPSRLGSSNYDLVQWVRLVYFSSGLK